MRVGEVRISALGNDFDGDLRCFIGREFLRTFVLPCRFDADDDEEFKLVLVDEHLSASPEFAARVANA